VKTDTEAVRLARSKAIQQLLALAPQSEPLLKLAASHGIETPFQPNGCIQCLFVKECAEIVGADALKRSQGRAENTLCRLKAPASAVYLRQYLSDPGHSHRR